ncbi:hypothetical protein ALE3EI_1603 [Constantimarinum furrinae]|uniref:Uncharacterized protein n=1 Tax=Constantimarinum furrinae TaxID=2562285 RepID=A0A7G8PUZ3_9FLAO|nr:hypothetical protein ALE3EI_1603 [Constantimarinum furrinae]
MLNKSVLQEKLKEFIHNNESQSDFSKRRIHYNSTINITNGLLRTWDKSKFEEYEKNLLTYFSLIKDQEFPLEKGQSIYNYHEFLLPVGRYLISKMNFISKANLKVAIIFGLFLDILFYFLSTKFEFLYFPLFTLILTIIFFYKQRLAIKEERMFSIFW